MGKIRNITGISEARIAPLVARDFARERRQTLVIVSSEVRLGRLVPDLSFFMREIEGISEAVPLYTLPEESETLLAFEAKNKDALFGRLAFLKALREGEEGIFIAPARACMKKLAPHRLFEEKKTEIRLGERKNIGELLKSLVEMGYERTASVESVGEYSLRGGILDIFPPDTDEPYRIEFFDDEPDSIRKFDPYSQRSTESLSEVRLFPAQQIVRDEAVFSAAKKGLRAAYDREIERAKKDAARAEALSKRRDIVCEYIDSASNIQLLENYIGYFYDKCEYLWDYAAENAKIVVDDPERIYELLTARERELGQDFEALIERGEAVPEDMKAFSTAEDFEGIYACGRDTDIYTPFGGRIRGVERLDELDNVLCRQMSAFNGRMDFLATEVKSYMKQGYAVHIVCDSAERLENLREFTLREGLDARLCEGSLSAGLVFPEEKLCYISSFDIFNLQRTRGAKRRKSAKKSRGKAIESFADLREGDYVVHENHGIGRFLGTEQLTVDGETRDYLKISYAGQDMLYVPVEQMDIVQKYVGSEGAAPKLNRLSSPEWKKTKARAKAAIANMARELIEISAKRKANPGYAFSPDSLWQKEFEDSFPYSETEDQLRCIEEIKADMERGEPMDRLLCGDVGFGKTEVAARAIFKALSDGKQAAMLVPTTILANQHYYTLKERFEHFPFTVEVLSRFKTAAEQKKTVEELASGRVDLVIGTHRLLSPDIKFKDIGLLVIDEEQRFGVEHKEAIKRLRGNVDVLTLSATPIPRTLHMSLLGIKNMSIIEEPPENRYPVQTYVMEQDDLVVKEAVSRELERGGQVYVVYNRIKGVSRIASYIEGLVPAARVAYAHGQMDENRLENMMMDFVDGKTNVLVSTTIIESGIDIPNVNTIIILDSDRYGLSQLYQLRGRVGRTNRLAYAYLMYKRDKALSEQAEKRLRAIRDFTEFGAGFRVAMRDLEIRGAGNILGMEQSGHMNMVGYELYCKFVDDAVRALSGEVVNDEREETSVELRVSAYIPEYYIADEAAKLHIYKRIAGIEDKDAAEDMTDELIDRFGDPPKEVLNLIKVSRIRSLAGRLFITRIYHQAGKIVLDFSKKNELKAEKIAKAAAVYGSRVFIHGGVSPFLRYSPLSGSSMLDELIELLETLL